MTMYIAAYDTEGPGCLEGVRQIVKVHEKWAMPATFFIVARLLDEHETEYKALLRDNPLFEVACHTYTHMPLVDTPRYGKAGPVERYGRELVESKKRIEDVFGRAVVGFRPPVSAPDGLTTAPEALRTLRDAGYRYVSSVAWGPDYSMPAPLTRPFTYADQGFPDIWELPPCGWHENLLKGNNKIGPVLLLLFPQPMPEAVPTDYVKTPDEEFRYNCKPFLDRGIADGMPQVSFIWHPWSLHAFDPAMAMIDRTFDYVRAKAVECGTFADLLARLENAPDRCTEE